MLFISFLLSLAASVASDGNPQLEINDGKIEGSILKSREGRPIFSFRGIPFAEPPLGSLRFQPPRPKEPWKNVLDATKPHAMCPQFDMFSGEKLPPRNKQHLPVMVFLHGGAFITGSGDYSSYSPELLLDHDIVLVIGNYRLGALGFLSTEDGVAPGNYGLKDQSLILKWVKKNIGHFGGDPRNVTLFGESAGGACSNFHMFSPLSSGLFERVISQSGTAFNFWALAPRGEVLKNTKRLAERVNCSISSSEELVECLRKIDPSVLVDEAAMIKGMELVAEVPFRPVIEPAYAGAFLSDTPYNLLEAKKFADVPWIVGMNEKEGLLVTIGYFNNTSAIDDWKENFNNKAFISLNYEEYKNKQIKQFYFSNEINDVGKFLSELTDIYTDAWFTNGLDEAIRHFRHVSNNPVFSYVFDHNGPLSTTFFLSRSEKFYGSCHYDDIIYLFPNVQGFYPNIIESEENKKFSLFLTTLWTNFARTGDPTPEINSVIRSKWEPVASDKLEHYYMRPKVSEMRDALFEDRVRFWRGLPFRITKDEF